ncbi:TIGR03364 family FAD-dependent oxidoreductase [Taibaiella chishuiensis]|uniref:FAD dependent oxidoreductase TIGR03364 n=1 Tax=Taibaiella chishuiensis TaxID=1434707 RepID=A0A2P8DDI3_9BACT|nr:TIGR03364 family FAD-dependent oxidoreductase [Taibaiella chishuiensis]PSK95278.1 FAD dependent oxidoreductase TIGR03364 [Taibaiella chishuiensis]
MRSNQFDVIIVGAGALGVFHAYHCLKAGKKVLLLEKDREAQEATVRNFGQVVPSGHAPDSEWHTYGRIATELYKEIQAEFPIGIRQRGSCYIAHTESEMAVLEEMQQKFTAADYECALWTAEQVQQRYPAVLDTYSKGALFFPQEVSAEPEMMIHSVLRYLSAKFGAQFSNRNNCAVIDVASIPEGCRITTADKNTYEAAHCIICSGRDFKLLFPEVFAESGLVVSKLNMMSTVPQPGVALPGNILTGLTIRRYESFTSCAAYQQLDPADVPQDCVDYGIHILFKQRTDGSIIIGDSHEYAPITEQDRLGQFYNEMAINDIILREAKKIVQLDDWRIARNWTGFYCQHKDEIFTQQVAPGIHIVTGIGGKGMTTSAGFAAVHTTRILSGS